MTDVALVLLGLIPFVYPLWTNQSSARNPSPIERRATFYKQLGLAVAALTLLIYTQIQATRKESREAEQARSYQADLIKRLDDADKRNTELLDKNSRLADMLRHLSENMGFNRADLTIEVCGKASEDFEAPDPNTKDTIRVLRYGELELQFTLDGPLRRAFYKRIKISERQIRRYLPNYPLRARFQLPTPAPIQAPEPEISQTSSSKEGGGGGAFIAVILVLLFLAFLGKMKKA